MSTSWVAPRSTRFRPAWFSLYDVENEYVEKKEWSNYEKFKYTTLIEGSYSLNRRGGWRHQLPKQCVNV